MREKSVVFPAPLRPSSTVRSPRSSSKETSHSACRGPNAWLKPSTTSGGASGRGACLVFRLAASGLRSSIAPFTASPPMARQYATRGCHGSLDGRRRGGGADQLPMAAQDLIAQPLDLRAAVAAIARQADRKGGEHAARRGGQQQQAIGQHQRLAQVVGDEQHRRGPRVPEPEEKVAELLHGVVIE